MRFSTLLVNALAAALVSAHGNHDVKREQFMRRTLLEHTKKNLAHCSDKIRRNGLEARNVQRRASHLAAIQEKRGIEGRHRTHSSYNNTASDTRLT